MKTKIITLAFCLFASGLLAQTSLGRYVVASAGSSVNTGDLLVSSTFGQMEHTTVSAGNLIVTQGFHQTGDLSVGTEEVDRSEEMNVYPNPVRDQLTVDLGLVKDKRNLQMHLYDQQGALLLNEELGEQTLQLINMGQFSAGNYLLKILDATGAAQNWRIVKVD